MKKALLPTLLLAATATSLPAEPILNGKETLQNQDFWSNKDFDWYQKNIPLFDCPDGEINATYYYRWELVTRHLVYTNPETGYAFTEFANRPFWSGAYGTIACPAGHQLYEVRWLNNPRYARDFMRFWMRDPGAQPRNYSFWAADAFWAVNKVSPNKKFITGLLPDLIHNYQAWENGHWVDDMGLFWQLGHDDGMEFDINARQTKDILRGGQSLRPSFNSYMWADAKAIADIAELKGEDKVAEEYDEKAGGIKTQLQEKLWDPSRAFFFPMSNQRHEKDGHVVEKHTLTYETGEFAGSVHGRELHGYVPWEFNLPDPGYEDAWQFLMDENFFKAKYGPTSVERNDPLFVLKDGCCWWSGQSWPFATTQTLKAMANLLQNYEQDYVDRSDYAELLHTFSISQRKNGKPYIAEALNPFTGSWKGHDMANRSEHYFHSGFTDLVITGLVGIQPSTGRELTVNPLAPDTWDFFALDNVQYHGHELAVSWDRTGRHYRKGQGLQVIVDGKRLARSDELGPLTLTLPATKTIPYDENPDMNYAVNNDGDFYPRYKASFVAPGSSLAALSNGERRYDIRPADRWTTIGSPGDSDWVAVDFGVERPLHTVKLYLLDDEKSAHGGQVKTPLEIKLEAWDGTRWSSIPGQKASPETPEGRRPYTFTFPVYKTSMLRATLLHDGDDRSGLTELEAWGPGQDPYTPAAPPEGNLAYNKDGQGFPKATATHSDQFGGVPAKAIDGKIIYASKPMNRWTSFGSENKEDSFELEFEEPTKISRTVLHIFDDHGGVRAPEKYLLEGWIGKEWVPLPDQAKSPAEPTGDMANEVTFKPVTVKKIRIVFTHKGNARTGLTELEVWKK